MPKTDILIEWLAFLLTAIAWIAFVVLRTRSSSVEAQREAGEKLCKWTGGYNKWAVAGSIFVLAVFALLAILSFRHFPSPDIATLSMLLNMTAVCVSFFPQRESLELCRNGIVIYRNGTRVFIPWKKMECMRISSRTGNVFIEETQWRRNPYRIPLIDVPAAIEVLRPLVMVRDADGRLLNLGFNPAAANLLGRGRPPQVAIQPPLAIAAYGAGKLYHELVLDPPSSRSANRPTARKAAEIPSRGPQPRSNKAIIRIPIFHQTSRRRSEVDRRVAWALGTRPQRNAHH